MPNPEEILNNSFQIASTHLGQSLVNDEKIRERVEYVTRNLKNRAGVRLLMACFLAKIHKPEIDVRKPYTEIGNLDTFSGRTYDEKYITPFIHKHNLPCNNTTAFLTPALRNRNVTLTIDLNLVGRPPQLYQFILRLLDDVYRERVTASKLLIEIVRYLLIVRNERGERIESLLESLKTTNDTLPLSSEDIVILIEKHMSLKGTSRLPVLIVAAAYKVAQKHLGEQILELRSHNAADRQTGALGDIEISLLDRDKIVTSYEMKDKKVTKEDIERALQK
ncbi:MAG: restriction endonuclease, SacI family, partial [Cyanobacteria bacterium P01_E01_bin.42]